MLGKKRRRYLLVGAFAVYVVLLLALVAVERRAPESNIGNLTDAFWYSLVTLSTVGYGDFYPVTDTGRLLGIFFVIGSLGLVGLLVGEVSHQLSRQWERRQMGLQGTDFTDHVVIIGWNRIGRGVTEELLAADKQVAIVTGRREDLDFIRADYPSDSVFVLYADLENPRLLEKVNLRESSAVLVNSDDDTTKLVNILNIRNEFPDVSFVALLDNSDLKATFEAAGVTYVLSRNQIASKLLASYIFEPAVAQLSTDLLSATDTPGEYDIQQYLVTAGGPAAGRTYGELFDQIRREYKSLLLGIQRHRNGTHEILKLPDDETGVDAGDYLILITDGANEARLSSFFGVAEGV